MAVSVRYTPSELMSHAECETFEDATGWFIHDDNSLELRIKTRPQRYRVIAHVHKDRWDRVRMLDEATHE